MNDTRLGRLTNVALARQHLSNLLPWQLRETTRGTASRPRRTLEDHAANYQARSWGPGATPDADVAQALKAFRAAIHNALEAEVGTIAGLHVLGGDSTTHLGLAYEVARHAVASEAGVPVDGGFERYLGTAIGRAIRGEEWLLEDPVARPANRRRRRRSTPRRPTPGIPQQEELDGYGREVLTAEAALAKYTQETDPRWRGFFGYDPLDDSDDAAGEGDDQ